MGSPPLVAKSGSNPVGPYDDLSENGRNEVAIFKQLKTLKESTLIDNNKFDDLLRKYSSLMAIGRVGHDAIEMEIGRQTAFFRCAYDIWYEHRELKNKDSTNYLKEISDSLYYIIKENQITNYVDRPYSMPNRPGDPTPEWKEYVKINNENNHENMIQSIIQDSLGTLNFLTPAIDKFISKNNFGTNKSAISPKS